MLASVLVQALALVPAEALALLLASASLASVLVQGLALMPAKALALLLVSVLALVLV